MTTINDYFEQARLSEAAYASNLTKNMFGGRISGTVYTSLLPQGIMPRIYLFIIVFLSCLRHNTSCSLNSLPRDPFRKNYL